MAEFDAWAEYYDLIHQGLPGEAEFYVGQAARLAGPTLEVGCGTGRIAIPMAMTGVEVTGLDVSAAMLDICREKAAAVGPVRGSLGLVQADMRDFDLQREFSLIAMPYRTFMHCLTPEDQRACLESVKRHLAADGRFILNVWAARPSAIAPHVGPQARGLRLSGAYDLGDEGHRLVHFCSSRYHESRQELAEDHLLHVLDADGIVQQTQFLSLLRAWFTPREMEHLVRSCGFEVEALFGDFDCGPFGPASTEMVWALRKG
jgi:SAM-dependent methyltransferase